MDGVAGLRSFDGVEVEVELVEESLSREGAFRSRGMTTDDFAVCCKFKFSLDGAGRKPARGTGSFEGLGSPDGLVPLVD